MKQILPLLIGTSVMLAGCTATNINTSQPATFSPRADNAFLTQQQAEYRSQRVSNVNYQLDFNLSKDEVFSGTAELSFKLKGVTRPITIDLNKAEITKLAINGNVVKANYNDAFITLQPEFLHNGNNHVTIGYKRKHSTNGEGLHRFKDSVDDRVYLYSHFEPAAANQMFPSFDQPDLKATYQITVDAPENWHVVTTLRESSTKMVDGKKRWFFDKTPKLSTYNFSLHAGPYTVYEDNSGKYPMRVFFRQSVADQVVPEDCFKYTKKGLTFFDEYFGIPYPFKKYDQLLVPDFLYGAMENAAAVTFAERSFLSSGKMSTSQEERLAEVIMHEMAHQWFGDLVTMKWWNGLWLNESFAAFMATLATAEATQFDYYWRTFYAGNKQSAYAADQRITTHPIEVPVPSTANAFDNIDAITYSKGASVLQQLRYLLTPETFRLGVHNYLIKYSYKNATLDDFINTLSETAKRDLSEWKQQWLYQPGVNTIEVDYQCANGTISAFSLKQTAPKDYPVLREQKVNVGLFTTGADGQLQLSQDKSVIYKGETTQVNDLIGSACPSLVYPNYQDWAFVKVTLDKKSFTTAKSSINKVADPLLRSMLWQSLWDSVRDGLLPLNEFLDVAVKNVAFESDHTLLRQVIGNIGASMRYLNSFGAPVANYRDEVTAQFEQLAWQAVQDQKDHPSHMRTWFNSYLAMVSTPAGLKRLKAILDGNVVVENLEFNQSMRWGIVNKLNQFDFPGALALIDAELEKDNSDGGQKRAIAAKAIRPDTAQKQYWMDQFASEKPDYPFSKLRVAMGNLYPSTQANLQEQTADSVIATLAEMDKTKGPVFMRSYAGNLIPSLCTESNEARLTKAIEQNPDLSERTKRALLSIHQSNQRCLTIAKKMSK